MLAGITSFVIYEEPAPLLIHSSTIPMSGSFCTRSGPSPAARPPPWERRWCRARGEGRRTRAWTRAWTSGATRRALLLRRRATWPRKPREEPGAWMMECDTSELRLTGLASPGGARIDRQGERDHAGGAAVHAEAVDGPPLLAHAARRLFGCRGDVLLGDHGQARVRPPLPTLKTPLRHFLDT